MSTSGRLAKALASATPGESRAISPGSASSKVGRRVPERARRARGTSGVAKVTEATQEPRSRKGPGHTRLLAVRRVRRDLDSRAFAIPAGVGDRRAECPSVARAYGVEEASFDDVLRRQGLLRHPGGDPGSRPSRNRVEHCACAVRQQVPGLGRQREGREPGGEGAQDPRIPSGPDPIVPVCLTQIGNGLAEEEG